MSGDVLTFINSQGHSCNALCGADGICTIETAPQSIEATFTGRHETFHYTKVNVSFLAVSERTKIIFAVFTRLANIVMSVIFTFVNLKTIVAKRLQCVVPIPPGELKHTGHHTHSTDEMPFHFCETR
jgi:hypothetical protein